MPDSDFGLISIVWMFLIVAGGWLLVSALVDIGGPSLLKWTARKLRAVRHTAALVLARAHSRIIEPRLR